jgi:hypothetical protein
MPATSLPNRDRQGAEPRTFRHFEATDPTGRVWSVDFLWIQNAISIRHADTVDVKFELSAGPERMTKVVALMHPDLLELSQRTGKPVTDPWVSAMAARHLRRMIETGEDVEKALVTPPLEALEEYVRAE